MAPWPTARPNVSARSSSSKAPNAHPFPERKRCMSSDHHQGFAKHDLGLCRSIHADSVGRPGQRYFRLVADTERGTVLLWLEKEQLYDLAVAIKQTMDRAVSDLPAAPPEQRSDAKKR